LEKLQKLDREIGRIDRLPMMTNHPVYRKIYEGVNDHFKLRQMMEARRAKLDQQRKEIRRQRKERK
jgi:hypothetical protein